MTRRLFDKSVCLKVGELPVGSHFCSRILYGRKYFHGGDEFARFRLPMNSGLFSLKFIIWGGACSQKPIPIYIVVSRGVRFRSLFWLWFWYVSFSSVCCFGAQSTVRGIGSTNLSRLLCFSVPFQANYFERGRGFTVWFWWVDRWLLITCIVITLMLINLSFSVSPFSYMHSRQVLFASLLTLIIFSFLIFISLQWPRPLYPPLFIHLPQSSFHSFSTFIFSLFFPPCRHGHLLWFAQNYKVIDPSLIFSYCQTRFGFPWSPSQGVSQPDSWSR